MTDAQEALTVCADDFPALFRFADHASRVAQRRYLLLKGLDLGTMLVAAILGVFASQTVLALTSALVMCCGLLLTNLIRQVQFERAWFDGRAVAESVKTMTWRYLTRADPYAGGDTEALHRKFLDDIAAIMQQRPNLQVALGMRHTDQRQITERMEAIRGLPLSARKRLYAHARIDDQSAWYLQRARANRRAADRWLIAIMIAQVLAVGSVIVHVRSESIFPNLTGVFTTVAAAALAWTQLRQHQVLAQAYGLAAQELTLIRERERHVTTNAELSAYVSDAEHAISREHTMWIARKEHP